MTFLQVFPFAFRRLWSHRGLALSLLAGLVAAVALALAVPLYADGVQYDLLNAALAQSSTQTGRSPFTFIFHYVGSWHTPIDQAAYTPVDTYMREQLAGAVGLPAALPTRYVSSDNLQLYPDIERIIRSQRLDMVKFAFVSGIFDHMTLVEGSLPSTVGDGVTEPIEGLVSLDLANDLGLEVGTVYLMYRPASGDIKSAQLRVRVSGIWEPKDPTESFWFYPPESFKKRLLIPEETFWGVVGKTLPLAVNEAVWRFAFDGSNIHSENVPGLLARMDSAQTRANALLPYTDLEASPVQALRQYRREAQSLTGLLFAFSIPVLGLALYFLGLVAAMLISRQRNEIAVLRSRGASRLWIAAVYLVEWSLLGLLGLAGGTALGWQAARWVGQTQSFLDFSRPSTLTLRMTSTSLGFGLAAVGLAVLFSLLPAWQAGGDTIISYKRERARSQQKPLWQRAYLDFLLLLPSLYGLYTLRAEGQLKVLGRTLGAANPFQNPLLFLLPTLFMLSLSLILLRFLPRLLSALAWLLAQLPGVSSLMAVRQLARTASGSAATHLGPLLLIMLTLGLAGFVSSMAYSLDHYLVDSAYYAAGADLNLAESGEYTGQAPTAPGQPGSPRPTPTPAPSNKPAVWNFLPVSDHLRLPGVLAAARVGRYESELGASGRSAGGRLIGIDRVEFPAVAFFRQDFASEPFIALMNRLAFDPSAILIDRATWEKFNLATGDQVELQFKTGKTIKAQFVVVGVLDYFPTLYPEDGPFFIANLEYLFEAAGGLQPYDVWLRTAPDADAQAIVRAASTTWASPWSTSRMRAPP